VEFASRARERDDRQRRREARSPCGPPDARGKRAFNSLDALDSKRTKREHSYITAKYLAPQSTEFAMAESSPLATNDHYEQACDQAIAMCGGNLRGAIKALIMANEYLEAELQELQAEVSNGAQARLPEARGAA
jgi:hypothetical protein